MRGKIKGRENDDTVLCGDWTGWKQQITIGFVFEAFFVDQVIVCGHFFQFVAV